MLKVKTGQSTKANAAEAGREAASYVKDEIKDMQIAFVYSGVQYNQKELIQSIKMDLPGVPVIGNT